MTLRLLRTTSTLLTAAGATVLLSVSVPVALGFCLLAAGDAVDGRRVGREFPSTRRRA